MIVKIHPVIIPSHLELSRNLKKSIRHTDKKPLDETDLSQYDRKTIFYDVFFNTNNTILYIIGPPMLNLENELLPISIRVNDNKVKFKQIKFASNQLNLLQIKLNNKDQRLLTTENNISINFGNKWTWQANVSINEPQDMAELTLCSLQKNNQIKWIKDWIKYYTEVYGVDRIILYDNNSDYQSTIAQELNLLNVSIVPWNFLFGPIRSHQNQFCQIGALNHCRLKFSNSKFCLNFDIDEMLVVKDKEKLFNLLSKYTVVYFDGFDVPFIKPKKEDYSFSDFVLRKQKTRLEEGYKAHKYIYNFSNVRLNWLHRVETSTQGFIIKVLSRLFRKLNKLSLRYLNFSLNSLTGYDLEFKDFYNFDARDAYFLHFIGITTNWKSSYWNRLEERNETGDLIEDHSVAEFFER